MKFLQRFSFKSNMTRKERVLAHTLAEVACAGSVNYVLSFIPKETKTFENGSPFQSLMDEACFFSMCVTSYFALATFTNRQRQKIIPALWATWMAPNVERKRISTIQERKLEYDKIFRTTSLPDVQISDYCSKFAQLCQKTGDKEYAALGYQILAMAANLVAMSNRYLAANYSDEPKALEDSKSWTPEAEAMRLMILGPERYQQRHGVK
jgi:hypothetical protein